MNPYSLLESPKITSRLCSPLEQTIVSSNPFIGQCRYLLKVGNGSREDKFYTGLDTYLIKLRNKMMFSKVISNKLKQACDQF